MKKAEESPKGNAVSKAAKDINAKLAEDGFNKLSENEQSKYNATTKKEQIDKISALQEDKENFKSISVGDKPLPSGVDPSMLWNTALAKAYENGDYEWINKLGQSELGSAKSQAGSTLVMSKFGKSESGAELATAERMKEARDAVKSNNPKGEQAAKDIVKEANDAASKEIEKQTLNDLEKEANCG